MGDFYHLPLRKTILLKHFNSQVKKISIWAPSLDGSVTSLASWKNKSDVIIQESNYTTEYVAICSGEQWNTELKTANKKMAVQ